MYERGLTASPQGCCTWLRRRDGGRLCDKPGCQSLGPLGSHQVGSLQSAAGSQDILPKTDGSRRPLGIPTFEDKVAQRAIVMVLEAVYEQDFLPCSFGFRPARSAHQALQLLRTALMRQRLRWVIDVDIEKYFDSIPHSQLR